MLALVALLLVDVLRISETLGLDVDDVRDVDRGHRVVGLRRKGGRTARAALPPLVADAIDTYLGHRTTSTGASTPAGALPRVGPLFVTRTGARWRPGNAARALTALAIRAYIPGAARVTPHALRHAAITLVLAQPAATTGPAAGSTATPPTPSPLTSADATSDGNTGGPAVARPVAGAQPALGEPAKPEPRAQGGHEILSSIATSQSRGQRGKARL